MSIAPVKVPRELLEVQQTVLEVCRLLSYLHEPNSAAIGILRQRHWGDLGTRWPIVLRALLALPIMMAYTIGAYEKLLSAFGSMALLYIPATWVCIPHGTHLNTHEHQRFPDKSVTKKTQQ
jgi:hypothetical protein